MAKINYLGKLSVETVNALEELATTIMANPILSDVIEVKGMEPEIRIKTDNLLGLIQLLEDQKKIAKESDKAHAVADKETAKAIATEQGAELAKSIEVGDTISFTMGSGKNVKTFTRVVTKKSDKSFTVEFDADYPCTVSPDTNPKKYIRFDKVVSFQKAVKPEAVAAA